MIDWIAARARLARSVEAPRAGEPADRARAVLDARARLLARRPAASPANDRIEVVTFGLGPERFAIETRYVQEIVRQIDLTPVPGLPVFVPGVANHRGSILCAIDLRPLIEAPGGGTGNLSWLIVLGATAPELGLLVDGVEHITHIHVTDILPTPSGHDRGPALLRGVTADAVLVVDGAELLSDPRLVIEHRSPEAL